MNTVSQAGHWQSAQSAEGCSDLNQVIARSEAVIVQAIKSGVSVKFALSPNVARVAVGLEGLRSILVGLCAEACSALLPGGRLLIETRGLNDAQIVSTTQPAPPAAACARLVVRAEQLPSGPMGLPPRSVSPSEVELGIAKLERALQCIGGHLELLPLPDSGLAYVAHLPYVSRASSSGRMPIAIAQGDEVILLVEDEPQVQAVTARILRAFGYSVITAHDERSALAQAELHGASISLVISDLVLPGVTGTDLVRRLRQPCEHARVLYVSGYSSEHVAALVEGATFLRKPFTADELVTLVRELLASSVH